MVIMTSIARFAAAQSESTIISISSVPHSLRRHLHRELSIAPCLQVGVLRRTAACFYPILENATRSEAHDRHAQ
jgi:hypothetical protein